MSAVMTPLALSAQPGLRARNTGRRLVGFCLRRMLERIDTRLCSPGQLPVHGIHRVLILRPNHRLGNAVLISPLLDEIETRYPGAEIDMVSAGCAAKDLFSSRFQVRRVICLPRRIVRHLWESALYLRDMRATRYDLAIDPCVASHSGRLLLGMAKARYKVGLASGNTINTLDDAYPGLPDHLAQRGVYILRRALGDTACTSWPMLDVCLTSYELQQGRVALDRMLASSEDSAGRSRPVLGVFANATGNKRLSEAWWGVLVAKLHEIRPDIRIVNILAAHGQSQLSGAQTSFYSGDLRKLAAVLAHMQGFVSADCGVMHLAAAVGVPTLGLFTRANRAKYTPYGHHNQGLDVSVADAGEDASGTGAAHLAVMAWIKQCIEPSRAGDVAGSRAGCGTAKGASS